MNPYNALMDYIAGKPEAIAEYPFGRDALVYKVCGKMFALVTEVEGVKRINLKCDPNHALELRSIFESVKPGYHMNKKHWNSVYLDGSLPVGELCRMVDHSYALIVKGLTKRQRSVLELGYDHAALYGES